MRKTTKRNPKSSHGKVIDARLDLLPNQSPLWNWHATLVAASNGCHNARRAENEKGMVMAIDRNTVHERLKAKEVNDGIVVGTDVQREIQRERRETIVQELELNG
jgi:hypothetical protein